MRKLFLLMCSILECVSVFSNDSPSLDQVLCKAKRQLIMEPLSFAFQNERNVECK